jgi:hypothetical protein
MEFLTIKDHRGSHFRGMEPYRHDKYDGRTPEASQRPTYPQPDRRQTPPLSSQRDSTSSWSKGSSDGNTMNAAHLPLPHLYSQNAHSASVSTPPLLSSSLGPDSRNSGEFSSSRSDWRGPLLSAPTSNPSSERDDNRPLKLPSFNSVSFRGFQAF